MGDISSSWRVEEVGKGGREDRIGLVRRREEEDGVSKEGEMFSRRGESSGDDIKGGFICDDEEEGSILVSCEEETGDGGGDPDTTREGRLSSGRTFVSKEKRKGVMGIARNGKDFQIYGRSRRRRNIRGFRGRCLKENREKRGAFTVATATPSLAKVIEIMRGLGFCNGDESDGSSGVSIESTVEGGEKGREGGVAV